jgi:hypothetical protein
LACHLRQNKWSKFGQQWWPLGWRQESKAIWNGASAKLAIVSGIVGTVTGIIGVIK